MVAHWHSSTHLGSTTIVAANTEGQMRTKTFPEFAVWFGSAVNRHWFTIETLRIAPAPWLLELVRKPREEGGLEIDPKYWYVQGQTWTEDNPSAFAGTHNPRGLLVEFDEASGIHSGVWDTTDGFFTEVNPYRFFLAASQMRVRSGRMHELFNDKQIGHGWRTRTLSTRGMPGVDQTLVADQIRRYGEDSDFVRVEIDGLPPRTSEDQFIRGTRCAPRRATSSYDDTARRSCSAWTRRRAARPRGAFARGAMRATAAARDARALARQGQRADREAIMDLDAKFRPDHICIDFGMGTGVIDILKRKPLHGRCIEVKFGDTAHDGKESEFATHAAELWARIREWLPGGMIEKDDGEKGTLSQQLTDRGWKWSGARTRRRSSRRRRTCSRAGVKSPDDADALACTFEEKNWGPRRVNWDVPVEAGGFDDSDFFR
jgi:hypothetical protein